MQTDIINDALVKIFTAERAGRYDVTIQPASKLLGKVLDIMQSSGYIGEVERVQNGRGDLFQIRLRGAINRCGVIKPRFSIRLLMHL